MFESIATLLIVAVAGFWLFRRLRSTAKGRACTGCGKCGAPPLSKP